MADPIEDVTVLWQGPQAITSLVFGTGDVIDGCFEVHSFLGQGGMGTVLRVESLADRKAYALKYGPRERAERKRFAREVRLMEKVRHAHVVPILSANLEHTPPYFVMPLAEQSLELEILTLAGREAEALEIFRQVCLGVQAIHECGIVHRDIKPANVLRFAGGRIAVSDFGVAKLETRDTTVLTRTTTLVGTLAYMAPEQFLPAGSREADVRTDVYQLGKVLYQLLTGRSPVLIEPSALPAGLVHVLQRATSSNPDDRYQDLGEFLDALRYYQLSKDPTTNAREALENLILQAEDLLQGRADPSDLLKEILGLLLHLDRVESSLILESFDRLPDDLLPLLASGLPGEFLPVLRAYSEAIRSRVARSNFRYADAVARRMKAIFLSARHHEVKVVALQTTLIAAVALNRFAAIGVFNRLLRDVQTVGLALPIAEMLRSDLEYYRKVAGDIPSDRLHAAVRDVQQEVLVPEETSFY